MKAPVIVVGLQWGDEGKGKIVDYIAQKAEYVVRFNGGNNAGHTVVVNGKIFKFHHLPSGAAAGKKLLIAQGEVVNPKILLSEIGELERQKIKVNLFIDARVHIVMPYHQWLDMATESWKGGKATGSLKLGIGYCYEDKNNRLGIRLEDLVRPKVLAGRVKEIFPLKKKIIEKVYGQRVETTVEEIIKEYLYYGKKLYPFIADVSAVVNYYLGKKNMVFEGAHGTFLDPSFGTYPYTVAPHCIAGAAFTGIGIGPTQVKVVGILKAYTTRVGNGLFLTEQKNKFGQTLQHEGHEIGTTSGRVRRCGWLDLPMLKSAIMWNGCHELALTKLDVLSSMAKLFICTHYLYRRKKAEYFPPEVNRLSECQPIYKEMPGWETSISHLRRFNDLPVNCRRYIEYLEKQLKVPIKYISVGAERRDIIIKH